MPTSGFRDKFGRPLCYNLLLFSELKQAPRTVPKGLVKCFITVWVQSIKVMWATPPTNLDIAVLNCSKLATLWCCYSLPADRCWAVRNTNYMPTSVPPKRFHMLCKDISINKGGSILEILLLLCDISHSPETLILSRVVFCLLFRIFKWWIGCVLWVHQGVQRPMFKPWLAWNSLDQAGLN